MDGKAGLVTGAASGIGRACAIRFAQEGTAVVVADLESAQAGCSSTPTRCSSTRWAGVAAVR